MSGGHYNYAQQAITYHDLVQVIQRRNDWAAMANDMVADGYPEAASPILGIVARIDALHAWVTALDADGLDDVAKAYDWWKSYDWDEERFRTELARYLDGRPKRPGTQEATE